MRILSMTATFGKLEHATLTLRPGLNVIHAPNEWGKSTWCAFLLAMLYGVDTRAKSTRENLADKEHYAPWSGSPMSGRIELNWQGRNITIERSTKGRIPMGIFRAYETESGMEVPELTAENCGQQLLGVERSVFRRAGFIRMTDLPVSQDDALRRRLNALVTTGDESGDGLRLERGLKELKNRCRYNRNGLLPQAEQERDALQQDLDELHTLAAQQQNLTARMQALEQTRLALENHAAALAYAAAVEDAKRVEQAEVAAEAAEQQLGHLEAECAAAPSREEARSSLARLREYREEMQRFQLWQQGLTLPPEMPRVPRAFLGLEPEEAMDQVEEDALLMQSLSGPIWWILLILAGFTLIPAGILLWLGALLPAALGCLLCITLLTLGLMRRRGQNHGRAALARKYGSSDPEKWRRSARGYEAVLEHYQDAQEAFRLGREELTHRREELKQQRISLCGEQTPDAFREYWRGILSRWDVLEAARTELERARQQAANLRAMARPLPEPADPDDLMDSQEQTQQRLQQNREEQQQLHSRIGQIRGKMEALGDETELQKQLARLEARIASLEQMNSALMLAQQTLNRASAELQRRFAPRIAKRAQSLMARMTDGRYDRITLGTDFALQAGAKQEDTLRDAQWRSDGTIDQLYLALRLSVAEELTPEAPLILDDALVRFDDARMKSALSILWELAKNRQVILFTCQQREVLAAEECGTR